MTSPDRRRAGLAIGFGLYFVFLWYFWWTPVVYPLKVFVVFLHEISHGIVAVATGGSIERITLDPRLGGACHCPGGDPFLTLSAGYLGSLGWGALLLETGRKSRKRPDRIVRWLGALVALLTVLFVRGGFGVAFGLVLGIGLILLASRASPRVSRLTLVGLGLTSCLYAVLDIQSDILDRPALRSDARMLFELTGVPTLLWGIVWITVAVVVSVWLLLRALRST